MKTIDLGILAALLIAILPQATPRTAYTKEATLAQNGGKLQITSNSPRPLAQVLDALQRRNGWLVNYEDPQYVAPVDVVETTGSGSSKLPSGGAFTVEVSADTPDEEATLRRIVDAYNKGTNPGRFELRRSAKGDFSVVGTAAHDAKGGISQQQVPFDSQITLAGEERSLNETVDQICEAVAEQMRAPVAVGIAPRSLLARNRAKVVGDKTRARELIEQSLLATHEKLYWRLLFDPNLKGYLLNIHLARP